MVRGVGNEHRFTSINNSCNNVYCARNGAHHRLKLTRRCAQSFFFPFRVIFQILLYKSALDYVSGGYPVYLPCFEVCYLLVGSEFSLKSFDEHFMTFFRANHLSRRAYEAADPAEYYYIANLPELPPGLLFGRTLFYSRLLLGILGHF